MSNYSIMHWSSLSQNLTEILNFSGHVAPTEKHAGSLLEGFMQTQISTLAVNDGFLVAGGFQGELACKRLDKQGVSFCTRTTYEENAITNAIEIYDALSGGMHFMASNNDCGVREYDMDGFQLVNHFHFPWPVNHTSLSPDRKLIAIVGDHLDGLLVDSTTGKARTSEYKYIAFNFISNNNIIIFGRWLPQWKATWTTHLQPHGIQMAKSLLQAIKTRLVEYGM
ncbi:uncharacterized protein LOC143577579 [Bidens hawaiensis]|uniref:uncharacterized protein LOC143577579 n=1 Tax=Bidens hawaiensis TaxID=980011 RepID=UPI00404A83EC